MNSITFEIARGLATEAALVHLQGIYLGPIDEILDIRLVETENCWIFFNNRAIAFPPERMLSQFSYVYSKHTGEGRLVPDFWDDVEKLRSYAKKISEYFSNPLSSA